MADPAFRDMGGLSKFVERRIKIRETNDEIRTMRREFARVKKRIQENSKPREGKFNDLIEEKMDEVYKMEKKKMERRGIGRREDKVASFLHANQTTEAVVAYFKQKHNIEHGGRLFWEKLEAIDYENLQNYFYGEDGKCIGECGETRTWLIY